MPEPRRNERGYRVGEHHHRATIADAVVHELRELHEHRGISYVQLVELFRARGITIRYNAVRKICRYERRFE